MFVKLIAKYGKILLDILIVGGIVFVFVMVNPFNIFGGGLKLQNTANSVSAVKEIGQLVTAEYYGEAIATYDQSKLYFISEEDISDAANSTFRDMKQYLLKEHLKSITKTEKKVGNKKGFFSFKWLPWISSPKKEFKSEIAKIDYKQFSDNDALPNEILAFYFNKNKIKQKGNRFQNLMWKLLQEVKSKSMELDEPAFNEYMLQELPIKEGLIFSDFHYSKKKKDLKSDLKVDLSMIGRGWVKAGIDFGAINDENLVFDKDHGIVHLYGVYPKILDKDINPWFIPEKQIPGFQIIESRNANFNHAVTVKKYCIDKLERMARDAGILEQAEMQAKESLKSFMGLLTETEIKEVHFHNDTLTRITNDIMEDRFVSIEEGIALDTLIKNQITAIRKIDTSSKNWFANEKEKSLKQKRIERILQRLKKCIYVRKPYKYQRLGTTITSINYKEDSVVPSASLKKLEDQKWNVDKLLNDSRNFKHGLEHRIWYGDSILEFIGEYNRAINFIMHRARYQVDSIQNVEFDIDAAIPKEPNTKYFYVATYDSKKRYKKFMGYRDSVSSTLDTLKYQIDLPMNWKKEMYLKKGYFERKTISGLDRIDSLNIIKIAFKLNKYLRDDNKIKADYTSVVRNKEGNWQIAADQKIVTQNFDTNTKAIVNYILNYYLQESERFSWFTKSSKKAKSLLTNDNVKSKTEDVKRWLDENINI